MRKITLTGLALLVAACFGIAQFGAGTAMAQTSQNARQQPQMNSQRTQMPRMNRQQNRMPQMNNQQGQMSQTSNHQSKTFTGTVLKEGSHFVLVSGAKTYRLNNPTMAKKYNNERVKVTGNLASNGKTIQVNNIIKTKSPY